MIKKLKLINFRGVREGELELGDLTILVGSNNSAKTTILEAFSHRSSVKTSKGDIPHFGWLGLSSAGLGTGNEQNRERLLMLESLLISSELVKFAQWYIYSNWAYIANCGIPVEVAEDISHLVNEEYTNITIEPFLAGKLAIFGLLKDGSRIRLGDLGAGTQVYIISRILYELKKPRILLWDDVEAHMNPRMLIRIAEWFFRARRKWSASGHYYSQLGSCKDIGRI